MKKLKKFYLLSVVFCFFGIGIPTVLLAQSFIHPGILHSKADLDRMKRAVELKQEPVYSGYETFIKDPASSFDYKMRGPLEEVGRNPGVGQNVYDSDANAAHQNAVMWAITGDKRYAENAIKIINAWAKTLKKITGRDAVLMAGLGPFKMVNAAEIIRYTGAGWKEADIAIAEKHFKEVVYPVLKDYAPFANGNWDGAAIKTNLAIGVFCNDRAIFEDALRYYTHGWGNGSIRNYIISKDGQIQESGRDQPHSQLGLGMLAESCAIAWNQGLDLYGYDDNLLLKGFEYVAKYNLGNDDMPFKEWLDRTGKYHHLRISDKGRGQLRPLFEQIYAHYVVDEGLDAPYVSMVVKKLRPEGPGRPGADHPGYGTLFFAKANDQKVNVNESSITRAPAGLFVQSAGNTVELGWIAPRSQEGKIVYTVKRATKDDGALKTVARNVETPSYNDKKVKNGQQYWYTVTAGEQGKSSDNSYVQSAVAGLPRGWSQKDVGNIKSGNTYLDGNHFVVESFGNVLSTSSDEFHYTYTQLNGDGSLEIRVEPQPSSQYSTMGIMLREDTTDQAPFLALMLEPGSTGDKEAPSWHTKFLERKDKGKQVGSIGEKNVLSYPAVTYGRLTGHYWLKIERSGNDVTAWGSYDGDDWQRIGETKSTLEKKTMLGIAVSSGMPNSTNVRIDKINVNGKAIK